MDILQLTVCGHIGKVQGLSVDRYQRDVYRFSLCCNFRHGKDESQLWLQCSVREPGLLQLCLERGVYTGEKLLITSHEATLAAALYSGKQTAFLNVLVSGLTFLSEVRPDAIVRTMDGQARIIEFSECGRG
jgi:hypothetical protein